MHEAHLSDVVLSRKLVHEYWQSEASGEPIEIDSLFEGINWAEAQKIIAFLSGNTSITTGSIVPEQVRKYFAVVGKIEFEMLRPIITSASDLQYEMDRLVEPEIFSTRTKAFKAATTRVEATFVKLNQPATMGEK